MAVTSGSVKTNTDTNGYFFVNWSQKSQDIPSNKTTISWECGVYCGWDYYVNAVRMSAVTIFGVQVYGGGTYSYLDKGNRILSSGTLEIPHDDKGNRSFTVAPFTGWLYSNSNYSSNGETFELTSIPRGATITSAPNFTDVDNPIVKYSNPLGNNAEELLMAIYKTDANTILVDYRAISKTGTSYTFSLTSAERASLRNATNLSQPLRFYIRTKIAGKYYNNYKEVNFTVTDNAETKPSVSMSVTLNNSLLPSAFNGLWVQNKSRANVKITAQGKYGATVNNIHGIYAIIDGKRYSVPEFTSDVIRSLGVLEVNGYAIDSRGFKGEAVSTFNVISYSKPLVETIGSDTKVQCYRSDENGNRKSSSTSLWVRAKRTFYSVNGINKCLLQWRKRTANTDWSEWSNLLTKEATTSEYNGLIPNAVFDKTKSYEIELRAIDDIGEYDTISIEIPTEDVALHLGKGSKNVTIGGYCDYSEDYTFRSVWKAYFDEGFVGTHANETATDVLAFALSCKEGVTPFKTWLNSTNIPGLEFKFSVGIVHKRSEAECEVYLKNYANGCIATNTYVESSDPDVPSWRGWTTLVGYTEIVVSPWTYRKWEDGSLEIWGRFTTTVGAWNAWGSVYESKGFVKKAFPYSFVSAPVVTASYSADFGGWVETYGEPTTVFTPEYHIVRPNNNIDVSAPWTINIYARGKWK